MRADRRDIDSLGPLSFVLFVGTGGGVFQALIQLAQPGRAAARGAVALTFTVAAAIVWWLGVRRRRYSAWSIALQFTAAMALADLMSLAIVIPAFVPEVSEISWRDAAGAIGTAQLGLSLIRFPVVLALVAAGRFVSRGHARPGAARPPEPGEHLDVAT